MDEHDPLLALAAEAQAEPQPQPLSARPGGLEEGDDILALAEAMGDDEEDGGADGGGGSAAAASHGPRLSWAAKAAAAGTAGAVPLDHRPRQAVLLPPGAIPRTAPPPPSALMPPPPAGGQRGVAVFGAPAAAPSGSGAGVAKGGFADMGQGSLVERYAGLKIKNPRVSHSQLRGRLADQAVLRLGQVKQRHRTAGLEGAWVTICVIGEKSKPRETGSGRPYSIWKVTDLDQTCLSLFLFSGAHSDLWREPEGTIVALMGPKVKAEGEFSLSVDSADQVWVLGTSPEFGHCKATKKNGEPCRMPVNATRCPFCPYHVQTEYNRLKPTGRTEFQTTNLKTAFRAGMQRGLQWTPGTFESAAAKQQRIKTFNGQKLGELSASARDRGSAAGARYLGTVANPSAAAAAEAASQRKLTPAAAIAAAANLGPTASALAAAPIPQARSGGTLVLQLHSQKSKQHKGGQGGKRKAAAAGGGAAAAASKRRASGGAGGQAGSGGGATASAGAEPETMVDLDDSDDDELAGAGSAGCGSGAAAYDPTAAARQRAIELLREAGGARAPDPNDTRPKPRSSAAAAAAAAAAVPGGGGGRLPLQQMQQQQRQQQQQQQAHKPPPVPSVVSGGAAAPRAQVLAARTSSAPSGSRSAAAAAPAAGGSRGGRPAAGRAAPAAPKSAMEAAFAGVLEDAGASAAAARGTRYKDLVDDEEQERLDKVVAALEAKDEMAAKMDAVTKLAVQAYRCKACGYTAERRRPECAAHPYAVQRVEVTKRWWQCDGCKYRFSTVGVKLPTKRCTKCNEPGSFTATSMLRPHKEHGFQAQQASLAAAVPLLARGNEQKWVNSW